MKIGSVVFAGLILAVGLVYEIMALNMPRGRLSYPGPGLFPTIVGVFLVATALGCFIQEILSRKKEARARRLRPSRTAIQQPRRAATYRKPSS